MRTFLRDKGLEEQLQEAEFGGIQTASPDQENKIPPGEDTERLKAERDNLRAYLLSTKGLLLTFEELPLLSVFANVYVRVYKGKRDLGYVVVSRSNAGRIISHTIDNQLYYDLKPEDSQLILQAYSTNDVKVEIYLSETVTLSTIAVVHRKPEKVAAELYQTYNGWGTDNDTALEIFDYLGAAVSLKFKEVAAKYEKLYSPLRGGRGLIDDTIHDMIDKPEILREVFVRMEYDASPQLLDRLGQEDNDTDSLAFAMRDEDLARLKVDDRVKLISFISRGNVGNPDEETIIRLLKTVPLGDINELFGKLSENDSVILKRLEKNINFSEYAGYHQVLFKLNQLQFFLDKTPKQVGAALENPTNVFAYRDSKITNAFKVRNLVTDVSLSGGKVHFIYWHMGPGIDASNKYAFSPFEPITILFLDNEETFHAKAGERVMMPAINLFALEDKQNMRQYRFAADAALTLSGVGGIFSAASKAGKIWAGIEVLMGAADITINEKRSEIAETEEGREFLKYWDIASTVTTVYGIGEAVMSLPQIFRKLKENYNAYKKGPSKLDNKELAQVDEFMKELKELKASVDKAKRDARETILDPKNTAHITARKKAWEKYEKKNPNVDLDIDKKKSDYYTKYDILAINRKAGLLSEAEFEKLKGGARKTVYTSTSARRDIDSFLDGTAREVKSGPVSLSAYRVQIDRDLDLLNIKGNGINKIEWHCFDGADNKFREYIAGIEKNNPALKGKFEIIDYTIYIDK